jgi:hypothetical protein
LTEYSHAVVYLGKASSDRITALTNHIVDIQKRLKSVRVQVDEGTRGRCPGSCVSIKEVQHDTPSQDSPELVFLEAIEGKGVCSRINKARPVDSKGV